MSAVRLVRADTRRDLGSRLRLALMLGSVLLVGLGVRAGVPDSLDIARSLSKIDGVQGWKMEDTLRAFAGEALYELVDGGAALYMEYGFVRAYAMRFGREEGRISVEVYEMNGPPEAFGLYSYLSAGSTTGQAKFGQEGGEGDGFILFWKGRWTVAVTTLQGDAQGVLPAIARMVDRTLPAEGSEPELVTTLRSRLGASDVVSFRGILGYQKRRSLIFAGQIHIGEGVSGKVDDWDVAVLLYLDEKSCRQALQALVDSFSVQSGAVLDRAMDNGLITLNGDYVSLQSVGKRLVQIRGPGITDAVRMADRVKAVVGQ